MSKKKDLSWSSIQELNAQIILSKKAQLNLRFQRAIGEVINFNSFKINKKNVARIMTELNKRRGQH